MKSIFNKAKEVTVCFGSLRNYEEDDMYIQSLTVISEEQLTALTNILFDNNINFSIKLFKRSDN